MRPEGVYEIVSANTEKAEKRVGRWVVFPFDLVVGVSANMLYTKQRNPDECCGRWLQTSWLKDVRYEDVELVLATENTEYRLERVL